MVEKQVVGPALAGGETVLGEGHRVRRQDDPRQGRQGTFRGRPVE
jgi:citrate synthase